MLYINACVQRLVEELVITVHGRVGVRQISETHTDWSDSGSGIFGHRGHSAHNGSHFGGVAY